MPVTDHHGKSRDAYDGIDSPIIWSAVSRAETYRSIVREHRAGNPGSAVVGVVGLVLTRHGVGHAPPYAARVKLFQVFLDAVSSAKQRWTPQRRTECRR